MVTSKPRFVELALVFVMALAAVCLLQWRNGCFEAEFSSHPDATAHYVTGLMVREYVRQLAPSPPMAFAERYYFHYPKVALGQWPPFFYVVQAAWTLGFTPERSSILCLMAVISALIAASIYATVRLEERPLAAMAAASFWILLPSTQIYSGAVMSEMLVTLLCFVTMIAYWHYLETPSMKLAVLFGLLASLALLTKPTAIALAFIPGLAILFTRRFELLAKLHFWTPALLVVAIAGPWYLLLGSHIPTAHGGLYTRLFELERTVSVGQRLAYWSSLLGYGLTALVAIGWVVRFLGPAVKGRCLPRQATAGAFLLGVAACHLLLAESQEQRHILHAVPALILFLPAGVRWTASRLPLGSAPQSTRLGLVAFVAVACFGLETFSLEKKTRLSFAQAAEDLLAASDLKDAVFLVSSEAIGEGVLIAEVAMREPAPKRVVLRASKVLAKGNWTMDGTELLYETPEEISSYLESVPVGVVVVDGSTGFRPLAHHRLLLQALHSQPSTWRLIASYPPPEPKRRGVGDVQVFRLNREDLSPSGPIRIDLGNRLKKVLELDPTTNKRGP